MSRSGKKRKILFISHDSGTYGAQMSLYWILKELDRTQYEAIVTMHKEGPFMGLVQELGWRVVKLQRIRLAKHERPPFKGLGERLTWWLWKRTRGRRVIQLIEEENIDLVHTNSIICFEGAYASYKTKVPHIWHIREILPGNRKLFGVFGTLKTLKMVSRYSDRVVCVSDAVKRQFSGWQRSPDKYVTVYNGVEPSIFNPDTAIILNQPLRERFQIPDHVPLIAYVARISPQKGFSDLVDACVLLNQDRQDFHVMILGEPVESRFLYQMQASIENAGLEEKFHFLGKQPQDAMPGYLKQMDIFISPSHHEPFARSILEAMAMCLPVVGTNSGGTPEAVIHNKTGLITKTGIPGTIAEALRKLFADPELRKSMGQAGRERVLEQFTVKQYVSNIQALYEDVLG